MIGTVVMVVILKLASKSPGELVKTSVSGAHTRVSDSQVWDGSQGLEVLIISR